MKTIIEYELTSPINHAGNVIAKVELREITAGDIQECGDIFDQTLDGLVRANNKAIAAYITELSGLPPSVVKQLSAKDFYILKGAISRFFVKESDPISES